PLRARMIAAFTTTARIGSWAPGVYNRIVNAKWVKSLVGFAPGRSMPLLKNTTLRRWYERRRTRGGTPAGPHSYDSSPQPAAGGRRVYLFCDEFSNYNDVEIGQKAILLLERLGYEVLLPDHEESGRTWLSKGLLRRAKDIANENIRLLAPLVSEATPLIGIEPSAILTFRDEYPDLASDGLLAGAASLAANTFLIDDFLAAEIDKGHIRPEQFTRESKKVVLHGHCQQKALTTVAGSVKALSLPANYTVEVIPSGCCGMAGSFGYEKEHFQLSRQIGELVLLPAVRSADEETIVAAPGTSCRHQIRDACGRIARHPVEVLYEALVI